METEWYCRAVLCCAWEKEALYSLLPPILFAAEASKQAREGDRGKEWCYRISPPFLLFLQSRNAEQSTFACPFFFSFYIRFFQGEFTSLFFTTIFYGWDGWTDVHIQTLAPPFFH